MENILRILLTGLTLALISGCSSISGSTNHSTNYPTFTNNAIKPNLEEIAKHPLGSINNPVRADGPGGQREYLSRLICTDGNNVESFERLGAMGISPYGSMVDGYEVICKTNDGETLSFTVVMDTYHKGYREKYPADGFKDMEL